MSMGGLSPDRRGWITISGPAGRSRTQCPD